MLRRTLTLAILALGACTRPATVRVAETPPPTPPPISEWPGALASALRAADSGAYASADTILARFALDHANTDDGMEADFWRVLLRLHPDNSNASLAQARAGLDAYLTAGTSAPRHEEARILRRLVDALDSTRTVAAADRAAAEARGKARDDEIRKLGEELEKTMAELDRIRRRLAQKPE